MLKKIIFFFSFLGSVFVTAMAFAGETELTTYYPAPTGEYQNLQAANSLTIPEKDVNENPEAVHAGEIWIEQ